MFLCYGYMLLLSGANVINCEMRNSGQCSQAWTQSFTVSGGIASTLWAYITDKPKSTSGASGGIFAKPPAPKRKRTVKKKEEKK